MPHGEAFSENRYSRDSRVVKTEASARETEPEEASVFAWQALPMAEVQAEIWADVDTKYSSPTVPATEGVTTVSCEKSVKDLGRKQVDYKIVALCQHYGTKACVLE